MKKIIVTGSNGQLGSELQEIAGQYPQYLFVFLTRNELPLSNIDGLDAAVVAYNPDFVINCAAYTAVDKAESDKEEAFRVNANAVGAMAAVCKKLGARFIHISTDYVFDGSRKIPLKEDDAVNPINIYGESKLAGEKEAVEKNPESVVIRTSWVYSAYGKNFVKTMLRLMREKETISVVNDQWGSPTYAADLANAIIEIIKLGDWKPGIFHFSNEGVISWFDFAKEIGSAIQTKCNIQPTNTENFPTPAKRPAYSVMDKTKIQQQYNVVLRHWKESLHECVQKIQASERLQ